MLKMGIFRVRPAASSFFSVPDHHTPCPAISTGFFACISKSRIRLRSSGQGHERAAGCGLRTKGRSFRPADSSKELNIISTGILRCTGPGYPLRAILKARSTNSGILSPSVMDALYLVSGSAIATSSISLKPPLP